MQTKYPSRQNVIDINQVQSQVNTNETNSDVIASAVVYIGKGIKQSNRTSKRDRIKSKPEYKREYRAYPSDAFRISKSMIVESVENTILQPIHNIFADLSEVYRIETSMNTSVTIAN